MCVHLACPACGSWRKTTSVLLVADLTRCCSNASAALQLDSTCGRCLPSDGCDISIDCRRISGGGKRYFVSLDVTQLDTLSYERWQIGWRSYSLLRDQLDSSFFPS